MIALVSQADCETRISPRVFRQWFTDDGSAHPNQSLIDGAIEEASAQAFAILSLPGWGEADLLKLVDADAAARGAICDLVIALGIKRRPEFWGEGPKPRWKSVKDDAEGVLSDIAQARKRSAGEATIGANQLYETRVTSPEPQFIFAPSAGRRSSGGF